MITDLAVQKRNKNQLRSLTVKRSCSKIENASFILSQASRIAVIKGINNKKKVKCEGY